MSETHFPTFKKWYSIPWRSNISNLFQRRISRITWQTELAQSELPEVAQETIRSVASQAGLTRLENLDVCNELVYHFEDGLGAGNSVESLVQKFGEPCLAANLIRRGKQRSRSVIQKACRALGWFSFVAVIGYVGLWIAFLSGQPSPAVDYTKSLNTSTVDSPESEKAWSIYREAWIEYGFTTPRFGTLIYQTDDTGVTISDLANPGDKDWPQTVAFMKANSGMYDAFRAAAEKPILGLELRQRYSEYDLRDLRAMSPGHFDPEGKLVKGSFDESELSLLEKEVNELSHRNAASTR